VATAQDVAGKSVTAQNAANTWTFTCKNITDVALAVSNTYVWDAGSVLVDDAKKRRASVQAAFPDASDDFHHSVQFSRYALGWFSRNWPGVPYPFSKSTAVQGFADMEYPMMVNDSHEKDLGFAQLVQDHEQAHTYFPFYMGINESYYAFMDEGWATTLEYLIGIEEKGKQAADNFYKQFRVVGWATRPHTQEVPIITPSPDVKFGAGNNFYGKPSLSYLALKDLLGDKLFKKALHTYMDNWNGKHPIPWDYFNSMKTGSGKNLDWFFYNWFFTPSYIDLALTGADKGGSGYTLAIKNIGGFAAPFDVNVNYTDGTIESFHQTPAVWEKDQKDISVKIKTTKEVKDITLEGGIFMDADMKNNTWVAGK
jgi:archaellum component FlaG (FlaF/FlaG flagellin family)